MILIVGLGNPGKNYERSRHNLGFQVLDRLGAGLNTPPWKAQHAALVTRGVHQGRAYMLAKPQTYMNQSGRAVQALLHYYRVPLADCLVIVDDLDLALGKVRQRLEGSDAGHLGLRSIIESVGSSSFKRIRIGIGRPSDREDVVSHVLGNSKADDEVLDRAVDDAAALGWAYLESGTFENWSSS